MDPVTVVGLLASIIQLINATAKAIKYLNDVKDAPKDRARLAREITNLLALLTDLRYRIEESNSTDPWFTGIRSLGVSGGPLEQFDRIITVLTRKLNPGRGVKKVGKSLLWTLDRKDIDRILLEIERLKTLINLSLQGDQFSLSQAIKKETAQVAKGFQDKRSQDILTWICPLNFSTKQDDFFRRHQEGTGAWLFETDEFKHWINGTGEILWCSGLPGAGKTILSSIVVDFLERPFKYENVAITYIYCSYKDQDNQTATSLLASLLQQLVRKTSPISDNIISVYENHAPNQTWPSLDTYSSLLQSEVHRFSKVFFIIDALDECSEKNGTRRSLLEEVRKLQPGIHLLVTSRHNATIEREAEKVTHVEVRASDQDIRKYLENRIKRADRLVLHVRKDPSLENTIIRTISEKAKGMFLLAQLHMDRLAQKYSCRDVRRALENLPKELDDIYDEAMKRIETQAEDDAVLAKRALSWIIFALRPLTIMEIQHALATEPEDAGIDEYAIPDEDILVSVCAGLVTIDQESHIIRLAHYTTQEYFNRTHTNWFPQAQINIATTCLTYLLFDAFAEGSCHANKELESRQHRYALLQYAARYWGDHACGEPEETVKALAQKFLEHKSKLNCAYQATEWLELGDRAEYITGLHVASRFGLATILRHLLKQQGVDINCRTPCMDTPLLYAVQHRHVAAVSELLEHGAEPNVKYDFRTTPLHPAVRGRNEEIVRLLLQYGADPNAEDYSYKTPLLADIENGHEAMVRLFLEYGIDPNSRDICGRMPIFCAVEKGYEGIVRLLIEYGVDLNKKDSSGRTPISYAAEKGHEGILRLLENGVDPDTKGNWGLTPISYAARNRHEGIVRLLFGYGVDPNSKDNNGRTPISYAAENGHEEIVRLLIEYGADVDSVDIYGATPLLYATCTGQESAVRLILESSRVLVDSEGRWGMMPLAIAAHSADEAVLRLLLDHGANLYSEDRDGQTPIFWAVDGPMFDNSREHEAKKQNVLRLLLQRGVDVEHKQQGGRTLLSHAAGCTSASEVLVRLLLEHGALVDSKDDKGRTPL